MSKSERAPEVASPAAGWVYKWCKGGGVYTVGFYDPDGEWHPESDHDLAHEAAERVHYLNGGHPNV